MSGTWKGYEKPGGAYFIPGTSYRYLPDCPLCRYGTIRIRDDGSAKCADCGQVISAVLLARIRKQKEQTS